MARARNIKPGFFTNDELVELPFEVRLLFVGLWTIADRDGRLADRPKKIKMEIFPADDVDCDKALEQLSQKGFITRYAVDASAYIQISNWEKHQKPHIKEAPSNIPAIPVIEEKITDEIQGDTSSTEQAPEIPVLAPENVVLEPEIPERAGLIVGSGLLIVDSPLLIVDSTTSAEVASDSPQEVMTPVFCTLPRNDGTPHPITDDMVLKWESLYPAVDVRQELRNMIGWCDAKPKNRKTKSGMNAFINGWLTREQNKGPKHETNKPVHFQSAADRKHAAILETTDYERAINF